MKKLKYTIVLAVVLLLSCFSASAASGSDILVNMDFVTNHMLTDGESYMTRAEFAYVASRLYTDEELAPCKTEAADVSEEHAYSGYIAYALGNGLMTMDKDNAFSPDGKVSVYEILKLYYDKMGLSELAEHLGQYPKGYYNLAVKHSILSGVKTEEYIKNKDAVRLISNIVNAEVNEIKAIYTQEGVKMQMTSSKVSMLEKCYGMIKLKAEITGIGEKETAVFTVLEESTVDKEYGLSESYNLPYVGVDMKAYKYTAGDLYIKDDEIVYFETENGTEVLATYIYAVNEDENETHKYRPDLVTKIELYDGEEYKVENLKLELNNKKSTLPLTLAGRFARIVIKNDKIVCIETWDLTEGGLISGKANGGLQYTKGTASGMNTVKFREFAQISVIINGRYSSYADIKPDSVFDYYADNEKNAVLVISEKHITDKLISYSDNEVFIGNAGYRYVPGRLFVSRNKVSYRTADALKTMLDKEVEAFADDKGNVRYIRLVSSETDSVIALLEGYEQKALHPLKLKITNLSGEPQTNIYEVSDKVILDSSIGSLDDMLHTSHLAAYDALYKFTVNEKGEIIRIEKPMSFLDYQNGINHRGLVPYEYDDYITLGEKRVYPYSTPTYRVGIDDGEYIIMYYSTLSGLRNRRMDKGNFHMRFISYETPNKLDCVVIFGDIDKLYLEYSTERALVTEKTEVYENGELYVRVTFVTAGGIENTIMVEASDEERVNSYQLYHYIQVERGYIIGSNYQKTDAETYDLSMPFDEIPTDNSVATGMKRGVIRSIDKNTVVFEDGSEYGDIYWRVPNSTMICRINHSKNKVEMLNMDDLVAGDEIVYYSAGNSVSTIFVK